MMERYADVMRLLQLVQHAIQHTYDAAHDECVLKSVGMPSQFYISALKSLGEYQKSLRDELEYIRQQEIIEDEVLQMTLVALRIDRLKEWMAANE